MREGERDEALPGQLTHLRREKRRKERRRGRRRERKIKKGKEVVYYVKKGILTRVTVCSRGDCSHGDCVLMVTVFLW